MLRPIVFDNGAGRTKAGYAGYDMPHYVCATVVGTPKHETSVLGCTGKKKSYIGEDAETSKGVLELHHPIQGGRIVDFDSLERIWEYIIVEKLKSTVENQPLLITGTPSKSLKMRQSTFERLFDSLGVSTACIQKPHALALYGLGLTTGVVLDSGEHESSAVSIYDGYNLTSSFKSQRLAVCGEEVTNYLSQLLTTQGVFSDHYTTSLSGHVKLIRDIKEKLCYVSQDFGAEREYCSRTPWRKRNYQLPDGTILEISTPLFECAEILFQPKLMGGGNEKVSFHELMYEQIQDADINLRRELAQALILIGGNTLFPGLDQRVGMEMSRLSPSSITVKVTAPPERDFVTWTGASILGSLSSFPDLCITREMFLERGVDHIALDPFD